MIEQREQCARGICSVSQEPELNNVNFSISQKKGWIFKAQKCVLTSILFCQCFVLLKPLCRCFLTTIDLCIWKKIFVFAYRMFLCIPYVSWYFLLLWQFYLCGAQSNALFISLYILFYLFPQCFITLCIVLNIRNTILQRLPLCQKMHLFTNHYRNLNNIIFWLLIKINSLTTTNASFMVLLYFDNFIFVETE